MALTVKEDGRLIAMLLLALCILSIGPLAHGLGQTLSIGGGQFITYEGSLSGSFTSSDPTLVTCGDKGVFYFSRELYTTIRIGVNPPVWDKNPFYFEVIRGGLVPDPQPTPTPTPLGDDEISTLPRPTGGRSISLPTAQPTTAAVRRQFPAFGHGVQPLRSRTSVLGAVFDLSFQSTAYKCIKDGRDCADPPVKPFESVITQLLDLAKASTTVIDERLTISDGSPYYFVRGDASSLVGDGTLYVNSFDSQIPSNYTSVQGSRCSLGRWPTMIWNHSTPFSYTLNFTNMTTLAAFTITAPSVGTFVMRFEGMRVDAYDREHNPVLSNGSGPEIDGEGRNRYIAISMKSPLDYPDGPRFTFANGSEFTFVGLRAVANMTGNETSSTSLAPGWKQTAWTGGGVGAWVGGGLFALIWAVLLC